MPITKVLILLEIFLSSSILNRSLHENILNLLFFNIYTSFSWIQKERLEITLSIERIQKREIEDHTIPEIIFILFPSTHKLGEETKKSSIKYTVHH